MIRIANMGTLGLERIASTSWFRFMAQGREVCPREAVLYDILMLIDTGLSVYKVP